MIPLGYNMGWKFVGIKRVNNHSSEESMKRLTQVSIVTHGPLALFLPAPLQEVTLRLFKWSYATWRNWAHKEAAKLQHSVYKKIKTLFLHVFFKQEKLLSNSACVLFLINSNIDVDWICYSSLVDKMVLTTNHNFQRKLFLH